ncbi:hypothetical protein [Streptomyces sp. NPDC003077]|uniref:hypothetical protein n=1 Tax=Streptomyces sp. NPDC003077 TaxID=3154443 RepID=UPI0033ACEBCB
MRKRIAAAVAGLAAVAAFTAPTVAQAATSPATASSTSAVGAQDLTVKAKRWFDTGERFRDYGTCVSVGRYYAQASNIDKYDCRNKSGTYHLWLYGTP